MTQTSAPRETTSAQQTTIRLDGVDVPFEPGETIYEISQRHQKDVPDALLRRPPRRFRGLSPVRRRAGGQPQPGRVLHDQGDARHGREDQDRRSREAPTHPHGARRFREHRRRRGQRPGPRRRIARPQVAGARGPRRSLRRRRPPLRGCDLGPQQELDDSNPFILRDYDKCISCYRCVRVCEEREGDYAISVMNRGFHTQITTEFDNALADSACTFCGQCVQTCPTGALADKKALRDAEDHARHDREDPHDLPVLRRRLLGRPPDQGRQARRRSTRDGRPGQRGRAVHQGPVRVRLRPAPRPPEDADGARRVTASSCRDHLGRGARSRRRRLPSRRATNTAATRSTRSRRAARPTSRPTRSRSSSAPGSRPTTSTTAAVLDTLRRSPVWRPRSDEARCRTRSPTWRSPDVIFCDRDQHDRVPPRGGDAPQAALRNGAKMIVADPRRIPLAEMATSVPAAARRHRRRALAPRMAHVIARDGLVDRDFVAERTEGEAFLEHVKQVHARVGREHLRRASRRHRESRASGTAKAERGAIYYTLGITEHICGVDNVQSLCNLALMTGNIGREGHGHQPDARPEQHPGRGRLRRRSPTTTRASSP